MIRSISPNEYGSFRACKWAILCLRKWVVLVPARGPRSQSKHGPMHNFNPARPKIILDHVVLGLCCFSCFRPAHQTLPKCIPLGYGSVSPIAATTICLTHFYCKLVSCEILFISLHSNTYSPTTSKLARTLFVCLDSLVHTIRKIDLVSFNY
jgi:hypothetical protein